MSRMTITIDEQQIRDALADQDIMINYEHPDYHADWREFEEYVVEHIQEALNDGGAVSIADAAWDVCVDYEYTFINESEMNRQKEAAIDRYIDRLTEYIKCEKIKAFQYIFKATPNYDVWTLIEAQLLTALNGEEANKFGLNDYKTELWEAIENWEETRGEYDWSCWIFNRYNPGPEDLHTILGQEYLPERFTFANWECKN